jgi:hypothetical protein
MILDFGFWILDFPANPRVEPGRAGGKLKIQNSKFKILHHGL